jgi:hypothetical protein
MKYIDSIYTTNQSGKLGGIIFSRNQYGVYSCMRKIPVDPKTPAQQTTRAGTARIARLWTSLTPAQRLEWTKQSKKYQFKKKGKTYFLSPNVFFIKLNKNLYEVGASLMLDFPSGNLEDPQNFNQFEVQMVNSPSDIDLLMFIEPAIDSNTKLSIFATMPVNNSESYGTSKRLKIAVLDSSFVSGSSIKDLYWQKYFQFPGKTTKVFFEIKSVNLQSAFASVPKSCETYGI